MVCCLILLSTVHVIDTLLISPVFFGWRKKKHKPKPVKINKQIERKKLCANINEWYCHYNLASVWHMKTGHLKSQRQAWKFQSDLFWFWFEAIRIFTTDIWNGRSCAKSVWEVLRINSEAFFYSFDFVLPMFSHFCFLLLSLLSHKSGDRHLYRLFRVNAE